jgi:hypothetical protein
VRDHPPDGETQNSPEDRHPGRAKQIIGVALNDFEYTENIGLVKKKLQRRFGLLPATAAVIAELAFIAGCSR